MTKRLRPAAGQLRKCAPSAADLAMAATVAPSGKVLAATLMGEGVDAKASSCAESVVRQLRFHAFKGSPSTVVIELKGR